MEAASLWPPHFFIYIVSVHTDGIHLNSRDASIVANLIEGWVLSQPRQLDGSMRGS
jgi:hypothetical protein